MQAPASSGAFFVREVLCSSLVPGLRPCICGAGKSAPLHRGHADVTSRSRGVMRPRLVESLPPLKAGAQGRPGARCTRGLVCNVHKEVRTRAYRFSGNTPAFPAQWLYGLYRALPGERAFLPPSPLRSFFLRNLTPASRCQDHTTSPSASSLRSSCASAASTASHRTFVTIASRPAFGGDAQS